MGVKARPYETRFSGGSLERLPDGTIAIPPIEVIYPGETADTSIHLDFDTGAVTYTTVVAPTPGLAMWWLRVRYRLYGRWLYRR